MLLAFLLALGATVAWCVLFSAFSWLLIAADEHKRERVRRGERADISNLH